MNNALMRYREIIAFAFFMLAIVGMTTLQFRRPVGARHVVPSEPVILSAAKDLDQQGSSPSAQNDMDYCMVCCAPTKTGEPQ